MPGSMRRRLFRRNSFLQKMLFSMLGLICIPLICVQLFMIIHSNREFKRETTAHYQYALQSLTAAFDSQLNELSTTIYRMCLDKEITQFISGDVSGYPLLQTAEKISRYALDSPLVDSVGVYYVEKDTILHNKYRRAVQHVCDDFFPSGSQGGEELANFLRTTDAMDYFYTGNYPDTKRKCLIIAKAFSIETLSQRDAVTFFVIDEDTFLHWSSIFFPTGEGFAILDTEGKYLLRGGNFFTGIADNSALQNFLAGPDPTYVPEECSDTIVYKCHESSTDFTFLVSMAKDTAEETFIHYTNQATMTLVITVVLAIVLLSVTLYINYKPVSRLMQKHFQPDHKNAGISELEMIDSHFFAQDERLNDQSRLLATFIIGDLLSGIQVDSTTLEKHFPAAVYRDFAAAVLLAPLTTAQSSEICQSFSKTRPGKLVITTVPYRTETVLVYCSDDSIDIGVLQAHLAQTISSVTGQAYSIRMGTVVDDVTHIQSSYNNALPPDRLFGEANEALLEGYPNALMAEFSLYVDNGNWTKALQALDQLEAVTPALKPSMKRFVHRKILNTYLSGIQEGGHSLSALETDHLLSFTSGQHLYSMLRRSISGLQDTQEFVGKVPPDQLRKRLLKYVDQNFANSELCLTTAADHLNTSVYTVSRIFKEITGYGFKEYISEKRLQQASHLLRESDMSVTDVASACGFESTNYFTAVFRMKYGMPPAKYRKEMAQITCDEIPDM